MNFTMKRISKIYEKCYNVVGCSTFQLDMLLWSKAHGKWPVSQVCLTKCLTCDLLRTSRLIELYFALNYIKYDDYWLIFLVVNSGFLEMR